MIQENSSASGNYLYHPMAMHLHTCHQPGGSMEGHIYNAASLGMRYIRFTDHDVRTGRKAVPVEGFDFTRGELVIHDGKSSEYGWKLSDGLNASFTGEGMVLSGEGEAEFYSSGRRHTVSLIAGVTLGLSVSADAGVTLDVRMSQRPPEHIPAHLCYVFDRPEDHPVLPHTVYRRITDGEFTLHLSDDAEKLADGGLDNVFDSLIVRVAKGSRCVLRRMTIHADSGYDAVIVRQRALADKIGAAYGVKPFVTTEISGAGQHKNCFSTAVPVIDYEKLGYSVTQKQAIDHVKAYGGIFSYNHPFSSYKRSLPPPEEIPALVARIAAGLTASRVYGASLMEVGFTEGRDLFPLSDYLRLWDLLSLGGVFITGYGDSDSHYNDVNWFEGCNFCSWIAAPRSMEYPVAESALIDSMKAGRLFCGDPTKISGDVCFTADAGEEMGSILTADKKVSRTLRFSLSHTVPGWTVRIVTDGCPLLTDTLDGTPYSREFELTAQKTVSFARCEVYEESGRCILLTNPIYFVRTDEYAGELPAERLNREEAK